MKTIKNTVFALLLAAANTALFAQTQPNPDAAPIQDNGPIKVLSAPPRQSSDQTQQQQSPTSIMDKIRLGGSFGLSFGSITNINISPMIGLQLTPKLTTGVGLIYQYYKSTIPNYNYQDNMYGARAFGMYDIISGVSAHVEYESISRKYLDLAGNSKPTQLNSFLVGGTYSQPTGGRLIRAVNITALYNLNYNNQVNPSNPSQNISPYGTYFGVPLVVRVSFF
jgi:hypothetical protein